MTVLSEVDIPSAKVLTDEEILVAELERLGIRYLSRQTSYQADQVRPPAVLLADLIRQPSARVRQAVIAVLLAYPEYGDFISEALARLAPAEGLTLRLFYTASVLLQQHFSDTLKPLMPGRWQWLPDLFSAELGVSSIGKPRERLARLGLAHQQETRTIANWAGTYENVARKLVRAWELETRWSR
jgi:hypothetical protein